MRSTSPRRADRPVTQGRLRQPPARGGARRAGPAARQLRARPAGAIAFGDMVIACSRSLVDETLRNAEVFSSADLVDQGNVRPLIPLAIDPPDHVRYRRLLDPLFAPRQIDRLEDDIAMRVNHFIDTFVDRGECDFTAEFAELFPSSVFLGMMGLDWDELDTLVVAPRRHPPTWHHRLDARGPDPHPEGDGPAGLRLLRRGARRARGRASRRHPLAAHDRRGRRRASHPRRDARHLLRAAHRRARHRHRLADVLLGVPRPARRSPAPARRAARGHPRCRRGAAPLGVARARRHPLGPRGPQRRRAPRRPPATS